MKTPPEKQDVAQLLMKFSARWVTRRPAVEQQARARAANVERLRQQLEAMARQEPRGSRTIVSAVRSRVPT